MALDAFVHATAAAKRAIGNFGLEMAPMWQIVIVTDAHLLFVDSCKTM